MRMTTGFQNDLLLEQNAKLYDDNKKLFSHIEKVYDNQTEILLIINEVMKRVNKLENTSKGGNIPNVKEKNFESKLYSPYMSKLLSTNISVNLNEAMYKEYVNKNYSDLTEAEKNALIILQKIYDKRKNTELTKKENEKKSKKRRHRYKNKPYDTY